MASIELWRVNSFRDRHGKMRHYFRPPGRKPVPLPGLPGSDEFMEAYRVALKECGEPRRPQSAQSRTLAGTLNAAIVAYYGSQDFKVELAASTQDMRRAILEKWRNEDGEKRFAGIRSHHLANMLEPMKPNAQKNWIKTLRGLMKFGKKVKLRADDPTQDVKAIKAGKSMGHMTWLEAQVAQYREHHEVGTMARLALELLLNIAGRRQDAHMLGRQHINRDGKLSWRPQKTRRSTGKTLTISIMPELQAALDAMPKSRRDGVPVQRLRQAVRVGCGVRQQVRRLVHGGRVAAGALRRWQDPELSRPRSAQGGVEGFGACRMHRLRDDERERAQLAGSNCRSTSTKWSRSVRPMRRSPS